MSHNDQTTWDNKLKPIELAIENFWSQYTDTTPIRLHTPKARLQLRCELQKVSTFPSAASLSPFETFLLYAAGLLYEVGWSVPDTPNLPLAERYAQSARMIEESVTRAGCAIELGLSHLNRTTVETLAQLCTAVGWSDLTPLNLEPEPVGYQEKARLRYLAALLQLADHLFVLNRVKDLILPSIFAFKPEDWVDARLALSLVITLIELNENGLTVHLNINPQDQPLTSKIVALFEEPIRRWLAANLNWLSQNYQYSFILKEPKLRESSFQQPLERKCKALIGFLEEFEPFGIVIDYPKLIEPGEKPEEETTVSAILESIKVGDLLNDQYVIKEIVGKTDHSRVVKAWDENLNRMVAIKFLLTQKLDNSAIQQLNKHLLREAQILAQFKHPNIGQVYHIIKEPLLGVVMEWVEGESFQKALDENKQFPVPEIINIGIEMAEALSYAHRQSVIHRDIKPGNIILTTNGEPTSMLIDFDIASARNCETISMLEDGSRGYVGTRAYSAPEQLRREEVGPPADMFALGVVMYELLTHRPPYVWGNDPSLYEGGHFPKPEPANNIPEPLYNLLCALLHEQPDRRPTAVELRDKLRTLSTEASSQSDRSPSKAERTEQYVDFELHIDPIGRTIARSKEGGESPPATISTVIPNQLRLFIGIVKEKPKIDEDLLKDFGKVLYELLFPGPIHTHLQETEAAIRSANTKLRIRLRIEANTLASLPLEFIYRELRGHFLAQNPGTVLSRYFDLPLPAGRVRRRKNFLRLLIIISNPSDQVPLNSDEWENIITRALASPIQKGQITTHTIKRATLKEIRNALLQQKPDIVQFIGYSIYQNGKNCLALVDDETGRTWAVDERTFADIFLGNDDYLGLVSLVTCESTKDDSPQDFIGIAPKIVQRGVPAVVAMQYEISVKTAEIFLENFYSSIAARKPVDWAVQWARNAISIKRGLDNRDFATPVLYMRAEDGEIF